VNGPALQIQRVSKHYRQGGTIIRALESVSMSVEEGQVLAVLGNNGAGKSTLMGITAGLLHPDEGQVLVHGEDVASSTNLTRGAVGLAPQDDAVYPVFTCRENLAFFGRLAGLRGSNLSRKVDEIARRLLLGDVIDTKASEMSGGQRRRLHTALALMHDPSIVLLDEPTIGVDIGARQQVLDFVISLADHGAAVVYSTHQLAEVERLGASVVILEGGRVVASGSVSSLVSEFAPPLVELRFDRDDYALPADLVRALDEAGWHPAGHYRVVARLADDDVGVTEVVDYLGDDARGGLVGAEVVLPNLESAYRRIVRGVDARVAARASERA
jgi:ABC-2 type transport system ATP-binding protein